MPSCLTLLTLLLGLVVAACAAAESPTVDVWIDTDPSIGLAQAEVDDGLALIQAFNSPELQIQGVSIVYGNTNLVDALAVGSKLVTEFGPPQMTVYPGASSNKELGADSPAVKAMATALQEQPLTILAIGPVTNVASLVKRHPELQARINQIVMVAGRRPGQTFVTGDIINTPLPDLNFESDVEAMKILLETSIDLVFAPWEVSSKVRITRSDLESLGQEGSGAWVKRNSLSWLALWERDFGVDYFNPFDTLAVGWVTHADLIESITVGVWIENGQNDRWAVEGLPSKPYLLVSNERLDRRIARYCVRPKAEFKRVLLGRLRK